MIRPSCTPEEKIREKREGEECYCRHTECRFHITSKTAWRGIRSSIKSSVCKFSDEKMNQFVY